MWTWLLKLLPKASPLAEAQKIHYETEIRLLNEKHEKEIGDLRAEIDRLKNKPQEKPKFTHSDLPDIQERILLFIAQNETGDIGPDASEIAHRVSVAREAIAFHLNELKAADLIESFNNFAIPMWRMKHEGSRYLIERGLIK